MKKTIMIVLATCMLVTLLSGCAGAPKHTKYQGDFMDTFDTVVIVMAYTQTQQQFNELLDTVHQQFQYMHKLFDIYHNYEGISNVKTINDNAGIQPVKVDPLIIDLIKLSKEWYETSNGTINIAMGSVLSIWHDYREAGSENPGNAQLPPMSELEEAARHIDIHNIIIDEDASTVYLTDPKMRLDMGAVAKGYATEVVADLLTERGYDSVLISAGGNVRAIGHPQDGRRVKWGVGIKDPNSPLAGSVDESNLLDVAFVSNLSVVSSGVYERFYTVDGKQYHHLIDPETLMPANHYHAVTVITEDSGLADSLSTALFIESADKALALAEGVEGVEALWVLPNDELMMTSGMKALLRDLGGASAQKPQ